MSAKPTHIVLRRLDDAEESPLERALVQVFRSEGGPDLQVNLETLDPHEARELATEKNVVGVAPAMPMRLIEPAASSSAGLDETGSMAWGVAAVQAHTSPWTGAGISVAVLDTGIDAGHQAFEGVDLVCRNFTEDPAEEDTHGHGTHCAGTIFGRDVDGVRIGVARGVQRALIGKVLGKGGGSSAQIVDAVLWAVRNGASVISMSLGMDYPGYREALMRAPHNLPKDLATSLALEGYLANVLLFERLAGMLRVTPDRPVVLVAAAGNESRRQQGERIAIGVSPPAAAEGFVSVAALQRGAPRLGVADFSNRGARIAAPGVDILSAQRGGGLVAMNGTSMAAPHAAGVAALWAERLNKDNELVGEQLLLRLVGRARKNPLDAQVRTSDVGAGLIVAPQEGD